MQDPILVIGGILALAIIYVLLPVFWDVFSHYRKARVVTCPRRNERVSVSVDAEKAALTALLGTSKLQIKDCDLWQDEMFCSQECRSQL